ncbi:sugar ABC transporter permease, partial [Rhizobium sp. L18]
MSSVTASTVPSTAPLSQSSDSRNNNTRWIGRLVIYGLLTIFA